MLVLKCRKVETVFPVQCFRRGLLEEAGLGSTLAAAVGEMLHGGQDTPQSKAAKLQSRSPAMKCMCSYSMHIHSFLVIFNSDKERPLVLCTILFCSIGFLLELLFRQFSFFKMSDLDLFHSCCCCSLPYFTLIK